MRTLITCIVVSILLNSAMKAQGTLQFNQIKLVGAQEQVPSGKAWKICGILPSARLTVTNANGSSSINHIIVVDGTNVYYATGDAVGSTYGNGTTGYASVSSNISSSALWLPANTTLAAGTGVHRISVIEFNIIP